MRLLLSSLNMRAVLTLGFGPVLQDSVTTMNALQQDSVRAMGVRVQQHLSILLPEVRAAPHAFPFHVNRRA